MPLWQMLILRSALATPVLWWLSRCNNSAFRRTSGWVIARAACLAVMWVCYYISLTLMPLAIAAATYYTGPLLIVALAALVARKWPRRIALLAITVGFVGVILVIQPDASGFQFATLLPLLSAWLYACAMVITSVKCRDDNPFALAMMLNIALILTGLAIGVFSGQDGSFVFGQWQPVDLVLAGTVVVLAVLVLIGSVGAAIAYQKGAPSTVAAFDYSFLVFSIMWGVIFFTEVPGAVAVVGITLIVGAGIVAFSQKEP
jgi:drug/metabolite transporter (DMT)-like permease